jgi:hypothetical protein
VGWAAAGLSPGSLTLICKQSFFSYNSFMKWHVYVEGSFTQIPQQVEDYSRVQVTQSVGGQFKAETQATSSEEAIVELKERTSILRVAREDLVIVSIQVDDNTELEFELNTNYGSTNRLSLLELDMEFEMDNLNFHIEEVEEDEEE